jgi:hypothetical protein
LKLAPHLAFALAALAAPASAIDLTGTWAASGGTIRCKIQSQNDTGFVEKDGNLVELAIVQEGSELWIVDLGNSPEYENKFLGVMFTSPKSETKGYGVATACTVAGKFYAGAIHIAKATADAESGKLTLRYTGTRLGALAVCTGRFERTSAAEPVIALTCP